MNIRTGLVADIGGTHARFALACVTNGAVHLSAQASLPSAAYASLEDAARAYLAQQGAPTLHGAVAACAGPVTDGTVAFTNLSWATDEQAFGAAIGLPAVRLINDLAAVAWAAPALAPGGMRSVQDGVLPGGSDSGGNLGVLAAGTGCNASALIRTGPTETVVTAEYGHASFAPTNDQEAAIWSWLRARFGRVSIERLLSGPGLLNIYQALCATGGTDPADIATPAAVSAAAAAGQPAAAAAVAHFCAMLGAVAGDVALAYGARGGLYLAGGVAAQVLTPPHHALFCEHFQAKGRFAPYLARIPVWLILDDQVALLGAARAMAALSPA